MKSYYLPVHTDGRSVYLALLCMGAVLKEMQPAYFSLCCLNKYRCEEHQPPTPPAPYTVMSDFRSHSCLSTVPLGKRCCHPIISVRENQRQILTLIERSNLNFLTNCSVEITNTEECRPNCSLCSTAADCAGLSTVLALGYYRSLRTLYCHGYILPCE
jgi:hypothetical protein